MSKKMTTIELKQYVIAEAKKLMKKEVLKEESNKEQYSKFTSDFLLDNQKRLGLINDIKKLVDPRHEKEVERIIHSALIISKDDRGDVARLRWILGPPPQNSVDINDTNNVFDKMFDNPLDKLKNLEENEDSSSLRATLHTLVGKEMRLEKRADNYGGMSSHHVEAHAKAKQELDNFLRQNPSMMEFVEAVESHFLNQLYK